MATPVTVPDDHEMIVGEQHNLQFDFTNLIAAGDVLSLPIVTVINTSNTENVPTAIIGSPSITNSVIMNVTVSSAPLRRGSNYVLTLNATATGGGQAKKVSALLTLKVIY